MCFTLIFGTLLTANGSLRFLNIFSFVGIIINVSLNFYLIPIYGATGSAFATFATQSSIALIQFAYCAKNFEFQFSFNLIGRYALFLILTIAFENDQCQVIFGIPICFTKSINAANVTTK